MKLNHVVLNATVSGVANEPENLTAAAYLLSSIVHRLEDQTIEPAISQVAVAACMNKNVYYIYCDNVCIKLKIFLSTASGFLDIDQRQTETESTVS